MVNLNQRRVGRDALSYVTVTRNSDGKRLTVEVEDSLLGIAQKDTSAKLETEEVRN